MTPSSQDSPWSFSTPHTPREPRWTLSVRSPGSRRTPCPEWAPVGPQISLAGLRRCSDPQHPPRDGPSAGPQTPRRHPRDLSEAQNAQGLPVPLHSPDPLIDRGARPNPREGNTALSATPSPSEPSVPTEGAVSPRCFPGLPHGGTRSLSGAPMLRVAGLPCCGLEGGAETHGSGAQNSPRNSTDQNTSLA